MLQDMKELREGIAGVGQEIQLTPDDEANAVFKTHISVCANQNSTTFRITNPFF